MELKDSFGRVHNYLRISLTDNCNLRCFYCMPNEEYDFTPASKLMSASEIESLAKVFVDEGVTKIRLTGGEPLVRFDAGKIITSLSKLPVELTLTTNGVQLHKFREIIKEAGIKSVNVSLDTLRPERFELVTRRNLFEQVWNNIQQMIDDGLEVKINSVIMREVNDQEINQFIAWTRYSPVHVRFIEYMPFTGNHWASKQVVPLSEILNTISSKYIFHALDRKAHDTSKKFQVPGYAGTFAVISTMSSHFCGDCNRMRLTADGKMKNCLFSKTETDLLSAWRKGDDVKPLIRQSIAAKYLQLGGQLNEDYRQIQTESLTNRSMITIGG